MFSMRDFVKKGLVNFVLHGASPLITISSNGIWSYSYSGYYTDGGEAGYYGGAAVTYEGNGKADNGGEPKAHTDIFKGLETQHCRHADS